MKSHKGLKAWNKIREFRKCQKAWNLISKLCSKSMNSQKEISYENYASKSIKSHKEIPQRPQKSVKIPLRNRTTAKKHEIAHLVKNTTVCHKSHTLLRWAIGEYTRSHASSPPLYQLYITLLQQPNTPTEPSNYNSMSSCHFKSFSNIRIDLL
jgi:hypothetical protein